MPVMAASLILHRGISICSRGSRARSHEDASCTGKCHLSTARKACFSSQTPHITRSRRSTAALVRATSSSASNPAMDYVLGIDFGTSGCRATVVASDASIIYETKQTYPGSESDGWSRRWKDALQSTFHTIPGDIMARIGRICFDGTSATTLLIDMKSGDVISDAKLYNESQSEAAVSHVASISPAGHTTRAATSALCKLAAWSIAGDISGAIDAGREPVLMHQCDWLAYLLHGQWCTDWNNALKLGFDPVTLSYPSWILEQEYASAIPTSVFRPGQAVGAVTGDASSWLGIPEGCLVHAGTTDSIAAFVAAGVSEVGEAVTSLGSTLAVKLLSEEPVEDAAFGVYSHRLGDAWLVGGASNVGGAVLRMHFTDEQLAMLSERVNPSVTLGLGYYPLPKAGERFPVCDPAMEPVLHPRPDNDAEFLQGMFEGIADVEARAYRLLAEMGASELTRVVTAGGGAANAKWTQIRQGRLGVPVEAAQRGEASYGAALLALRG